MRIRSIVATAAVAALAVLPLRAVFGMGTKPEPPPASSSSPPGGSSTQASSSPSTNSTGARMDAERAYALAYEELAKARKDAEAGNKKNADKKYKKVLERVENAVHLDPNYHEAWNLVGYAARKLGDYDKAFAAYDRCLAIKPDFAAAREYLGEAWLEKGDLTKSRAQLAALERLNTGSDESKALRAAIDAYVAAHPQAARADSTTAPTDSAATQTGVK